MTSKAKHSKYGKLRIRFIKYDFCKGVDPQSCGIFEGWKCQMGFWGRRCFGTGERILRRRRSGSLPIFPLFGQSLRAFRVNVFQA